MRLEKLIAPKSIAIVGVSSKQAAFQVGGRAVFEHLRRHGYPHRIDLVTREKSVFDGIESVTDLADLKTCPDCVVISVPAKDVYDTMYQALELGVRAFIVVTSGFSEAGDEGAARQAELVDLVVSYNAVMLGPNTTGLVNFSDCVAMSSTSRISTNLAAAGEIGLVVQSGALGSALLEEAMRSSIGLSHLISTGNEATTDIADCIDYLVEEPRTKAIALYVEAFRRPEKIIAAARRAHFAGKPIVLYKAGRSDIGRQAAAGHTGALVGARGAYDAAVRQLGWVDVRSIEDLLPVADYLVKAQPAKTVGVLTVSGGLGGCVADALDETGVISLPPPGDATMSRMRADVPSFLSAENPIDIGGTPFRRSDGFAECLTACAEDPAFDALVVANTPIVEPWARAVTDAILSVKTDKPISTVWPAEVFNSESIKILRDAGVPVFTRIDTFTTAVSGAATVHAARETPSLLVTEECEVSAGGGSVGEAITPLSEATSKAVLEGHGLRFPREIFIPGHDLADIGVAAVSIGYPIVLKAVATGVVHKSELGLVAVGLPDNDALKASTNNMLDSIARHALDLEGFLVAETVRPHAEIILSLGFDPEFGATLTFGAGGIYTELIKDVAVRILPVDRREIHQMIDSCRIGSILRGARGRPPLDLDPLVEIIMQVAALAPKLGRDMAGFELNPVGIGKAGDGAWVLDATVFCAGESS